MPLRRVAELELRAGKSPTAHAHRTGSGSPRAIQRRRRPQELADLTEAYEAGATVRELAARFGIHRNTVSAHLERAGVAIRTRHGLSPGDVDEVAWLYQEGWSGARLAKKFGVSDHTIRATLRAVGVSIRLRHGAPGWSTRNPP